MQSVLNVLTSRRSSPVLNSPAPSESELIAIFQAALSVPDHGQVQPYRFRVFQGEGRLSLGQTYRDALEASGEKDEAKLARAASLPVRAPMVVVALLHAAPEHPKAPINEQRITAGLATYQMMLAANALGYGTYWRTGDLTYMPELAKALSLKENEEIIGFIYIGTSAGEPKPMMKKIAAEDIWQEG